MLAFPSFLSFYEDDECPTSHHKRSRFVFFCLSGSTLSPSARPVFFFYKVTFYGSCGGFSSFPHFFMLLPSRLLLRFFLFSQNLCLHAPFAGDFFFPLYLPMFLGRRDDVFFFLCVCPRAAFQYLFRPFSRSLGALFVSYPTPPRSALSA